MFRSSDFRAFRKRIRGLQINSKTTLQVAEGTTVAWIKQKAENTTFCHEKKTFKEINPSNLNANNNFDYYEKLS